MTKYIFVTGGVVSGLGKGITAASLGRLLKSRGLKIAAQKLDPYINVDPGTMSPFQHGEVYVTDDGAETDLDLGHYERFIDEDLNKFSNLTTGKVYWNVLNKERAGEYLGETVQVIPHITNEIKSFIYSVGKKTSADVVITEIGGTVGDFAADILEFSVKNSDFTSICDACAVAWWVDDRVITKSIRTQVDVETKGEFTRGMTVCDWRDFMGTDPEQEISREKCWNKYKTSGNVEVAMEFDQKRFREVLFDTVRSYKEMN